MIEAQFALEVNYKNAGLMCCMGLSLITKTQN